jgi:hypothetical protein
VTDKPKSSVYANRKARMERDPEFRAKVYAAQSASRAKRRQRELEESGDLVCGHEYANGRRCWKVYAHTHGGEVVDPGARELVAG